MHKNSTVGLGVRESENKQSRPGRPASKALCLQSCRTRGQREPRAAHRPELPDKDDSSPRRAISGEATDSSQGHKARGRCRPPLARTAGPSCPCGAGHRGVPSKPALPLQVDVHRSDPGHVLADVSSLSTGLRRSEVAGSGLGRRSDPCPRHPNKTHSESQVSEQEQDRQRNARHGRLGSQGPRAGPHLRHRRGGAAWDRTGEPGGEFPVSLRALGRCGQDWRALQASS